jgi:hypothetical protein
MQSEKTPHRVARPGGDVFVSHEGFIEYLYDCAQRWAQMGEAHQSHLVRKQILRAKRAGQRRCPVCVRARLKAQIPIVAVQ